MLSYGRILFFKLISFYNAPRALQMLITLLWMALEATQNNVVAWNLEVMADIIAWNPEVMADIIA